MGIIFASTYRAKLLIFWHLVVLRCFRFGSLDLNLEIRFADFQIKDETRKRILLHRNVSARWISLKKFKLRFLRICQFCVCEMVLVSIGCSSHSKSAIPWGALANHDGKHFYSLFSKQRLKEQVNMAAVPSTSPKWVS